MAMLDKMNTIEKVAGRVKDEYIKVLIASLFGLGEVQLVRGAWGILKDVAEYVDSKKN